MSKVSRSVYQKLSEENKRLKLDIKVLVSDKQDNNLKEWIRVFNKWRSHFLKEKQFNDTMKEYASEWFKNNPNNPISIAIKKHNNEKNN